MVTTGKSSRETLRAYGADDRPGSYRKRDLRFNGCLLLCFWPAATRREPGADDVRTMRVINVR
ncbi:hypothetical protein WL76_03600 [Burkholderia ubonensis]|nr:hypothetical protein WL76_03600 [Burkholderia ubonensis]